MPKEQQNKTLDFKNYLHPLIFVQPVIQAFFLVIVVAAKNTLDNVEITLNLSRTLRVGELANATKANYKATHYKVVSKVTHTTEQMYQIGRISIGIIRPP